MCRGISLPSVLIASLTLAACLAVAGCGSCERAVDRPNLLLISIDTLRADHLGAYGYGRDTSPRIDRLAAEGVLFEQLIAETSWTLPAHVTLFSGLESRVHRVTHDARRIPPSLPLLAERLRAVGYRTEAWVSAPYLHPIFGFDRGFDRYEVLGRTVYDEEGYEEVLARGDPAWRERAEALAMASHRTQFADDLASRVESALAAPSDAPFFWFVHIFDVHSDYDPPESYWRRYDPDFDDPDFDPSDYARNPAIHRGMSPVRLRNVVARYDGEIRWTDEHVGRMIDALDRSGHAEDTLVVVLSDHGEEFFEHGQSGHRKTLFDEQLRIPWILRWPGELPAGLRIGAQAAMVDVLPTLLELLGREPMPLASGASLAPWMRGGEARDRPAVSFLFKPSFRLASLRKPEWKLLQRRQVADPRNPQIRLFDLVRSPEEQVALSSGPRVEAAVETLRTLERATAELQQHTGGASEGEIAIPDAMREALEQLGYVDEGE